MSALHALRRTPILLTVMTALLACNGGDGEPDDSATSTDDSAVTTDDTGTTEEIDGYLIGSAGTSTLWTEIESDLNLAPFEWKADQGVWIATNGTTDLGGIEYAVLRELYDQGYPIVLVEPTQADIDNVADGLDHARALTIASGEEMAFVHYHLSAGQQEHGSTHLYGYETEVQITDLADREVAWYVSENAPIVSQRGVPNHTFSGWPTQENWPYKKFTGYMSNGVYFELFVWVYPIMDTTNQVYKYGTSMELDLEPYGHTINQVRLRRAAPTIQYYGPIDDACNPESGTVDVRTIEPQTTVPSGSVTAGFSASVGASVGMNMTGPTGAVTTTATISASTTTQVPSVSVANNADLPTGTLDWAMSYNGGVTADTGMVFGAAVDVSYANDANYGDPSTCGWTVWTDIGNKNPRDQWIHTLNVDGATAVQLTYETIHVLNPVQAGGYITSR